MKTDVILASTPNMTHHALEVMQRGGTVAFPTDTVYGLAALAWEAEGIERLYMIKGREHTKAIAILIGSPGDLLRVAESLPEKAQRLTDAFWPGPLTVVVPRHPSLPETLSPTPTIGVRMPDHPVALDILRHAGPLAVTSANLSGEENTVNAEGVLAQLGGRVHMIVDGGETPGGVPSTVLDLTGERPRMLREGPITQAQINTILDL